MIKLKKNEVLILKGVSTYRTSYRGFQYPESGEVQAPDFDPRPECGQGLHGFLRGEGNAGIYGINGTGIALLIAVDEKNIVDLGDKVKFEKGRVVFCGERSAAVQILREHYPEARIMFSAQESEGTADQVAGDESTQTAGDESTQTAGYRSTQTAGYESTQTAGYGSTQTAGYRSTQTAGDWSTQTAGDWSTQTAGDESTQTAGYRSTQKAGYRSTQKAGYRSTQTAGDESTQTAGDWSTQTAGNESKNYSGTGSVVIRYYGGKPYVKVVGGEPGMLKPNTWYWFEDGEFSEIV